jgi:hypothetical protein
MMIEYEEHGGLKILYCIIEYVLERIYNILLNDRFKENILLNDEFRLQARQIA